MVPCSTIPRLYVHMCAWECGLLFCVCRVDTADLA